MDMEQMQAVVEQACEEFKHPATHHRAEHVLLQFRRSPNPIPACQYILERSASAEARFHAACTLREAVVSEWASTPPEQRRAIRSYALAYASAHAAEPGLGIVRAALVGALGLMLKRGWGEMAPAEREAFFREVEASAQGDGPDAAARLRTALEVLEAVVSEFSLATASALGVSWEFHERCRNELEAQFLQGFFRLSCDVARSTVASSAAQRGEDAGACAAAMALICAILNWGFRGGPAGAAAPAPAGGGSAAGTAARRGAAEAAAALRPGQAWAELLLPEPATDWLLSLLPALRGAAAAGPLAVRARQVVVAFCSLGGEIFPRAAPGEAAAPAAVGHCARMLRAALPWVHPAGPAMQAALAQDESELLDGCRALSSLASNHKPATLSAAGDALAASGAPHAFQLMEDLTCAALAAGGAVGADAAEPWVADATEALLDAWSSVLSPQGGYATAAVGPPAGAGHCAARTFAALVEAALADAAAGAHEDATAEDEQGAGAAAQEEWLSRAAVLARAAPAATLPLLCDRIAATQGSLVRAASGGGGDVAELLEQLCWLARASAHVLADPGVGEMPLPPEALLLAFASDGPDAAAAGAGAERLSCALLELAGLCLDPGAVAAGVCSPRLMEVALWAAARWADTYLFPEDEPLPAVLEARFGAASGGGQAALELLARAANRCLTGYPGESDLHGVVTGALLPVLVRRRGAAARLLGTEAWRDLAGAFARRDPRLAREVPQKQQRALARSLCAAAAAFENGGAAISGNGASSASDYAARAASYVRELLEPTVKELGAFASAPPQQLAAAAQRADAQLQACCLIETLRGAVRATLPSTQPALWGMFSGLLPPLLALHWAFRHQAQVVALLLKFADDMVESQAHCLPAQEAEQLLGWALKLLTQYSESNLWQVSLQTAKSLRDERQAEQCRDLRAVLNLLLHVTQSELVEDSPSPAPAGPAGGGGAATPGQTFDPARVVLVGLHIVLPLINPDLLKFPKLGRLYYSLLSYLLEAHAGAVAALEPRHFGSLMASLEWGLAGGDAVAAHSCLEGVAGLARFQLGAAQTGAPGLAAHAPAPGRSVVAHFQEMLLRRLLLDDTPQDAVELASDALLPLLLAEPSAFQPLATSLVAAVQSAPGADPRAGEAVGAALSGLAAWLQAKTSEAAAGEAGGGMNRQMQREFRQAAGQMVSDVRAFTKMR